MTLLFIQGRSKGYWVVGEERALVITNGNMQALDGLVSGLAGLDTVNAALAVSDAGHIVGWGEIGGNRRAFIAIPMSSNLVAASTRSDAETTDSVTGGQAQPLLAEAIARWSATGVDVSALDGLNIRIVDLPGTALAMATGNTIWIDNNAAGWGWFRRSDMGQRLRVRDTRQPGRAGPHGPAHRPRARTGPPVRL